MNKSIILLLSIITIALSPLGLEANTTVEVRSAAFLPSKKLFREIYGDVGPNYQVEASTQLCKCYYLFLNIDEYYSEGRVQECGRSSINILNASMGPKMVRCINTYLDIYAGIGLNVAWTHLRNYTCCSVRTKYDVSCGGVAKVGANVYLWRNFFVDIFCDYQYQPAFKNRVDIGGFKPGLGLGYSF